MSSNLQNSIWPNEGGTLGQIKVQIPDGINTTWPEGDALVGNFVYKNGKLVGFVDTKALIANDSKTTTFPYDYVNIQVDKSLEGVMTFNKGERTKYFTVTYSESGNSGDTIVLGTKYANCRTVEEVVAIDPDFMTNDIVDGVWNQSLEKLEKGYPGEYGGCGVSMFENCFNLTTFISDLSSLTNGTSMFNGCSNLTTFTSDLSSLTNGTSMFRYCTNLTTFTSDLSSLTSGDSMFENCTNLTTFTSDLSNLTNAYGMFYKSALASFTSDLSNLTDGSWMFHKCNLTTFTSDLSSLTNGNSMFSYCSNLVTFPVNLPSLTNGNVMFENCTNLTTFTSDLSSLISGYMMFWDCKLDTASVKNIAETINTVTNKPSIHIGIGNTTPTEEENTYLTQIHNKGWQVYVNGSEYLPPIPLAITTLDENGEEITTPIPFWAKPVPATEETASYVDSEGNFYNILGGQFIFVDDPDTYGMFLNEEDAAAQMRLTKIGEEEIETA